MKKFLRFKVVALILSIIMSISYLAGCANLTKTGDKLDGNYNNGSTVVATRTYTVNELPSAVQTLDFGEGIEVQDIQATYVSEEYFTEKAYNSIGNLFLGYTAEELLELDGDAWFFSIDDDGEIAIDIVNRADMLAEYEASLLPPKQNNTLRNFLIGGGVILVTATLSVFGTPAVACIALGAFKGAVIGATVGSAVYAAGTAISYRVSEGTWEGSGNEILESASEGFMIGSIVGAATGALSANNCFVAGTPILLASGETVAIENIKTDMNVVCADEQNPYLTTMSMVVDTFSREVSETYIVDCGDVEIETTDEHPFFVQKQGWVKAEHLAVGDKLISASGETLMVESVTCVRHKTPVKVYNFEVENQHTYYVGEQAEDDYVLVHNSCAHMKKEWTNERTSHWKKSGQFYKENYSAYKNQISQSRKYIVNESNIQRMLAGKAPLDATGKAVQLHHWNGGILNDMYSYVELTKAEHYANFKTLHYWLYN